MNIIGQLSLALIGERSAPPCEDCGDKHPPHTKRWIAQSPYRTVHTCDYRLIEVGDDLAYNPRPTTRVVGRPRKTIMFHVPKRNVS